MDMIILLCLFNFASAGERIVITNQDLRSTRNHEHVYSAGSSFANARVPGVCGWSDTKACFMMVTLIHGNNCSLSSGGVLSSGSACGVYGDCGFSEGSLVTYISSDLSSGYWGDPVEILPFVLGGAASRPRGVYSRPHIIFNAASGTFVLWVSWRAPESAPADPGRILVATCTGAACPSSPFTVVAESVALAQPTAGVAAALFVDDDGAAYVAHAAAGGGVVVERLTAAWTSSAAAAAAAAGTDDTELRSKVLHLPTRRGGGGGGECDSPAMFKRGGVYYVLFGQRCCYCAEGSDTYAFAARSPLGPFLPAGTLGNLAAAQQDAVVAHGDVEHVLWMGSVWGKGFGGLDYTPSHWAYLQFYADAQPELPAIRPLEFFESFSTNVHTP